MASNERQRLKGKYRRQRALIAALPVLGADRKRLSQQLSLHQVIDRRALKQQLSRQRKAIHNTTHPGSWRHFVATCAVRGDALAIRLLDRPGQGQSRSDQGRGL